MSAQFDAHKEAVSLFRKYSKDGGSDQLKDFAEKTLPILERRLSMVEDRRLSSVAGKETPKELAEQPLDHRPIGRRDRMQQG